ncbi:chitin synthase [Wickerhamomyces ciferrii]|uniref:chitin synthase n=1 Tax=Wickerhamomyces ciferrii (strain ATCC 14091 / BCRC 22168 / CBS 111 / JCM 3599 / NBRC 0793 / NRRL Y-1031 F-60-10) TaxID=1206466 RepID=K0KI95_WICCF|nr:chitin synthase [Wickerhamomyces ciferrii]CCH44935.1 chitin synthase [Wickerhamomyces ciferrii]
MFRSGSLKRSSLNRYESFDDESQLESQSNIERKRSLIRPERNDLNNPNNPHYYYAQLATQEQDHINVNPSSTGIDPTRLDRSNSKKSHRSNLPRNSYQSERSNIGGGGNGPSVDHNNIPGIQLEDLGAASSSEQEYKPEGREIYGLNDEYDSPFTNKKQSSAPLLPSTNHQPKTLKSQEKPHGLSFWQAYCYAITFWAPGSLLKLFGMPKKDRQMAWREKIGLVTCILYIGAFVAFLTFGFTKTVCNHSIQKFRTSEVGAGYLVINGKAFDLTQSSHPEAAGIPSGSNILYPPIDASGKDASFLFQNVNGNCKGLITPKDNCTIPTDDDGNLAWYMPCKMFTRDEKSTPNFTVSEYYDGYACHTSSEARDAYYSLKNSADVYFDWKDLNDTRNFVVYSGNVLDLDLLDWIQYTDLDYPSLFDELKSSSMRGYDISILLADVEDRKAAKCLNELIKVGVVDADTIGCIASQVVLYSSLVFILSVVFAKFILACFFKWVISPRQGADIVNNNEMNKRNNEIEDWSDNINAQGPIKPARKPQDYHKRSASRMNLVRNSRYNMASELDDYQNQQNYVRYDPNMTDVNGNPMTTMAIQAANKNKNKSTLSHSKSASLNNLSIAPYQTRNTSVSNLAALDTITTLDPDIIHPNVVPQPPIDYQPFNYPLAHVMTLVTCYSEDEEGLRTTLDSIATSDYPNSHRLIVILCDGLIKGSGNDMTTPEIALNMMTDFSVEPENVKPYSNVAVAQGEKRHNMSKVYSGFYKYDSSTVPVEKQQRVPILTIVKCGTPKEATSAKPGNRGKRDSQIILMSFLQKITFDERMTELEYDILLNIWRITGLLGDMYEIVLMVDADTKVYPDALTHMIGSMVKDPEIMGLCGETKIANKRQSWVTAIQVFEYYISHHQAKAFESVFGGVTCLPGCFCMYRIKAPKSADGYWVPILANPDIVERYSDNVVDTLHKKNLLLLGEDRFLSTLMLKTFPKRKQVFVSKACCKTVAPDKFKVLLSQRRRWINSTVHNLMELVLVNDLCGTFCFSMQFVIGIELVGTLVLPAAISFTIYVIIVAIVSKPTPVMSLILLALILGLPGLIIIITASRTSYLIWMFIYILALPIWNFVLPAYAYWKFDDFSWGETRTIAGGDKGHEDGEGEFDHSMIKMRRWREFERERQASGNNRLEVPRNAWDPSQHEKNDADVSVEILN